MPNVLGKQTASVGRKLCNNRVPNKRTYTLLAKKQSIRSYPLGAEIGKWEA